MSDYNILLQLIPELEAFETEKGKKPVDLPEFVQWMATRHSGTQTPSSSPADKLQWHGKGRGGKAHYTASNLLTAVGRYKMGYVKMALEHTAFETYDEFAFVLSLVFAGPYTQSQLIERHVQLKPTGTEIIRRLLRKELIAQEPSGDDKRSKFLHVTEAGRTAFHQALTRVNAITDMMMAPLTEAEQLQLLDLMQKLDTPHRDVFNKKLELNEVLQKFGLDRL